MPERPYVSRKYDFLARIYDWIWHTYTKKTITHAIALADLSGNERVFDIGCGTGALEKALLLQFPGLEVIGCDISVGMMARALQKLQNFPQVTFFTGDFLRIPIEKGGFDCVFSLSNLHYFPQPSGAFAKAAEMVKPGGKMVLVDWNGGTLRGRLYQFWMRRLDKGFKKAYSPPDMEALFQQTGWQVETKKVFSIRGFWTMVALRARK